MQLTIRYATGPPRVEWPEWGSHQHLTMLEDEDFGDFLVARPRQEREYWIRRRADALEHFGETDRLSELLQQNRHVLRDGPARYARCSRNRLKCLYEQYERNNEVLQRLLRHRGGPMRLLHFCFRFLGSSLTADELDDSVRLFVDRVHRDALEMAGLLPDCRYQDRRVRRLRLRLGKYRDDQRMVDSVGYHWVTRGHYRWRRYRVTSLYRSLLPMI